MGIKLNIEITSPMTVDDHELLSGIAVMTLAIANHELAKEKFPEAFSDEEDATEEALDSLVKEALDSLVKEGLMEEVPAEPPQPCGAPFGDDAQKFVCVGKVGHRGRHKFRAFHTDEEIAAGSFEPTEMVN